MKDQVTIIKRREFYRPFAASVLQEHVHELFAVPGKNHYSPFMNFCFQVKPKARKLIASIVHADNSCRIQTVNRRDNGIYYDLIREFYKLTKIPAILNTSYNLSHEPIIEHPEQAIFDFVSTKMDALVIEKWLITRHKLVFD
jgi:carbamoyltransferase